MGREIEIKIPLTDSLYQEIFDFMTGDKSLPGLSLLGKISPLITKEDEYYSKYKTEAERRANDEPQVIRLRTDDDGQTKKSYFTLKRKTRQNGIEVNAEDETFVQEPEVLREFFALAGFFCWFKKQKQAYGVHCNFAKMPGLDYHLELEIVNNLKYVEIEVTQEAGAADQIRDSLNDFVKALNLNPENRDARSWVEIVMGKCD